MFTSHDKTQFTVHNEIVRSRERLEIEVAGKNDRQVTCLAVFNLYFGYSVQLCQQDLNLSESDVLSFWIVQQMSCSHNELNRRLMYQLKFAYDRYVLSVEKLE